MYRVEGGQNAATTQRGLACGAFALLLHSLKGAPASIYKYIPYIFIHHRDFRCSREFFSRWSLTQLNGCALRRFARSIVIWPCHLHLRFSPSRPVRTPFSVGLSPKKTHTHKKQLFAVRAFGWLCCVWVAVALHICLCTHAEHPILSVISSSYLRPPTTIELARVSSDDIVSVVFFSCGAENTENTLCGVSL